ncbi:hypothetical protein [Segeticoccus rhizosphaerae]|uniref:hypothetical protein n=1 Tax=Segeticoccus rhizosphaerae TaxID=1104777 RepID=UPI00126507F6|nr:hypothetical protein [Segeticoccus rhizosphaerae]
MPETGTELADLVATVEELRARDYPDLDPDLVGDILVAHQQFAEDRAEARKRTEQLINRWVSAQPAPEGTD